MDSHVVMTAANNDTRE